MDAGSYSLTAIARDDSGNTTASSTRDIIVRSATLPNTAVFVQASDHETAVYHYVLEKRSRSHSGKLGIECRSGQADNHRR